MSTTYTTYLMIGVRIPTSQFPGSLQDEVWLPYSEGHEGTEITIVESLDLSDYSSSPQGWVYIGKTLASWCRYGGDDFFQYVPDPETFELVDTFLTHNLNWTGESAKLMFFTVVF